MIQNNDINKNNDVVRAYTLQKGIYVIGGKGSKTTSLNVKCGENVDVFLVDDFGRKQKQEVEGDFNMVAPEGSCIHGVEVHVKGGSTNIVYKEHLGFAFLKPYRIALRKRLLMLLKKRK